MSIQKPSSSEEEYILRQEALEKHKAAVAKSRELAASEAEELKKLHHMKCPKCGMDLQTTIYRGVSIDMCHNCHGTWLDAGELEQLAGKGGDVLSRIVSLFHKGPGPVGPEAG